MRFSAFRQFCAICLVIVPFVAVLVQRHDAFPATKSGAVRVVADGRYGSGVHIGGGLVLTAAHVIDEKLSSYVIAPEAAPLRAEIVWIDTEYDIALLRIDGGSIPVSAKLDCSARLAAGDSLTAIGDPGWLGLLAVSGRVASAAIEINGWKSVHIADMTVVSGMSGGPVFDSGGGLVAVVVGALSVSPLSFVVPLRSVCDRIVRE